MSEPRKCRACGKQLDEQGRHDCVYVCKNCGHQPCPFCGDWCCNLDADHNFCCGGKCELVRKEAKGSS